MQKSCFGRTVVGYAQCALFFIAWLLLLFAALTARSRHSSAAVPALDFQDAIGTVAVIIESPFFANEKSRISSLAEILAQQRSARRIVAYAIGSGDTHELWDAEKASASPDVKSMEPDVKSMETALRMFIERTAANRTSSMYRILDRVALALQRHAEEFGALYRSGMLRPRDESFRLRLLIAAQVTQDRLPRRTVFRLAGIAGQSTSAERPWGN